MSMSCAACGRHLSNDPAKKNAAKWTTTKPRMPYCAKDRDCERETLTEHRRLTRGELPERP